MVRKPTSGDSEQRDRDSERARKASQLSAGGADFAGLNGQDKPRTGRGRDTPSNGGPEEESAHGALMREGIDSD
jgi:hypothetical protein